MKRKYTKRKNISEVNAGQFSEPPKSDVNLKQRVPTEQDLEAIENESIDPLNVNNCEYRLTMKFNEETFDCWTNNLKVSMMSFIPSQFHTEGYIKIQKGTASFERMYSLIDLRQLLTNEERLDIFIDTLVLG